MTYLLMSSFTAIAIPAIIFILAMFLSMRMNLQREKMSPFECGFDPNHYARIPFSMRFFLLAIIFLVFDIEIVLLVPTPVLMYSANVSFLLMGACSFIIILIMGLLHEWKEGSLDWSS